MPAGSFTGLFALLLALLAASPAAAQGHGVALRLRPRLGDTVRTRFEQTVRVTPRDADPDDGVLAGEIPASVMLVIARSIVERVDANGAQLLAVTDSVAFHATGAPPAALERLRRQMQGKKAQLRVAPDGAMAAASTRGEAPVATTLRLPGTLPASTVTPGATWRRAMAVPSWGAGADPPHLDVAFRLDSVTGNGARAFISLRGRVHGDAGSEHDGTAVDALPNAPHAVRPPRAPTVDGELVVDLARGWVTESWATFRLDGVVGGPAGDVPVRVTVTQRLRAY